MTGCGDDSSSGARSTESDASPAETSPASSMTADSTTTSTALATTSAPATSAPVMSAPATTVASPLFDFVAVGSSDGWSVVNDTVMGGVSSGELAEIDGVLVFSGELSLDNNGGFASVRSPMIDQQSAAAWASRVGPRIEVDGDGRTWTVEVRTDGVEGGWISTLSTSSDAVTDTVLPWTSFVPVSRFLDPREADGPLDPSRLSTIAFYLVDGVEGPFRLGIRSIS